MRTVENCGDFDDVMAQPIHDPIWPDDDFADIWIGTLGNHPPRFWKQSESLDRCHNSTRDQFRVCWGILRDISAD